MTRFAAILSLFAALSGSVACRSSSAPAGGDTTKSTAVAPSTPKSQKVARFGGRFGAADPASFDAVLASPDEFSGRPVIVEGHVRRACSRRGCWMELAASPAEKSPACRVTFKDYGFFVPTDAAGSHARVQGSVRIKTVSAARVRHLSEEGATFQNLEHDGSARELEVVATAVELTRTL
jgi:hypothetical protein